MLNAKIKNFSIISEDHDDLHREEFNSIVKNTIELIQKANHVVTKKTPENFCYNVMRFPKGDWLIFAYAPQKEDNPYVFYVNESDNIVKSEIPYKIFQYLKKDFYLGEFSCVINNINEKRFLNVQMSQITKQVYEKIYGER